MAISSILIALLIITAFLSFVTVQQGTIAVVTIFGKYRRIMGPGLNMKIPFFEQIYRRSIYSESFGRIRVPSYYGQTKQTYILKQCCLYSVVNTE
jgi:regulator of protease activity HflC (stomatin/prohibitin superfamily)